MANQTLAIIFPLDGLVLWLPFPANHVNMEKRKWRKKVK